MNLNDVNRMERLLGKFKESVRQGNWGRNIEATPEENQIIEQMEQQIQILEDSILALRLSKGSVAGLVSEWFKINWPRLYPQMPTGYKVQASENTLTIKIPVSCFSVGANRQSPEYQQWWERFWGTIRRQRVLENKHMKSLSEVHPGLKVTRLGLYSNNLEICVDFSKSLMKKEEARREIFTEALRIVNQFVEENSFVSEEAA